MRRQKYLLEYNKDEDDTFIMYSDANSLYGGAMGEHLPYAYLNFSEVNDSSLNLILNTSHVADIGYIVEIDLHVPEEMHDQLKRIPTSPRIIVNKC